MTAGPRANLLSAGYDLLVPPRIVFGWGRRAEVGTVARTLASRRAFLVIGSRTLARGPHIAEIEQSLADAGLEPVRAAVISQEPEVADVDRTVAWLIEHGADPAVDAVVAVGGGAGLDLAKAAAALVPNAAGASVVEFLEGVGSGRKIEKTPLPMLALPTTGGTGSEATKNAVISSYDPPFKKSLRSDLMVPRAVLVDPELAVSAPAHVTAASGLDAITQCIESYISRRAKPIPRALAAEGLCRAVPALPRALADPADRAAREALAHAALLSGVALANSGLGMAHGVAAALGVHARTPHGVACALMLPAALEFNRPNCEADYAELARAAWPAEAWRSPTESADDFVRRITALCEAAGVPRRLRDVRVGREQLPAIVAGSRGNSLDGNPVTVSDDQLHAVLERHW